MQQTLVLIGILKGSSQETNAKHNADMALILSECKNVYSAEVPTAISNLDKLIAKSEFKEDFIRMPFDERDAFLKTSTTEKIKSAYIKFIERHGHRCIQESDFIENPWREKPSKLMKMVKLIVQQSTFQDKQKKKMSVNEIIESLHSTLSPFKKWLLKQFFIMKATEGLAQRGLGKLDAVRTWSIFKKAYWKIAAMMVRECRILEERLLFF